MVGDGPDGPCIRPPNIWSSIMECAGKYEIAKNGEMKEFVVVKWRVLLRKGHIIMLYTYNEISDRQKTEKRQYTTKKRSSEMFGVKKNFLRKVIRKFIPRNFFPFPPSSAPSLRPWFIQLYG